MPDTSSTTGSTSTAGNAQITNGSPAQVSSPPVPDTATIDGLTTALAAERTAHGALRNEHGKLKGEYETASKSWTTEKETLTKQASEASQRALKAELRRSLSAAGCLDVDVVASSADFAAADPDKTDELVGTFKEAHPGLFRSAQPSAAGSFDGGSRGTVPPGGLSMNDRIRRASGRG